MTTFLHCRALLGGALLLAAMTGCSVFKSRDVPLDSSAGLFDKARLNYQVDTNRINAAALPHRGEGQLVAYQQSAPARLPAGARASVEIRYPHPDKREGVAQVQVKIAGRGDKPANASAWKRWWIVTRDKLPGVKDASATNEIWTLDISKSELATIVSRLNSSGYFAGYEKSEGAEIITELDGSKVSKSWHQVPEIDALIVRVRTDGRLVSSSKAPDKTEAKPSPSVAFYRKLLATDKKEDSGPEGYALATDLIEPTPVTPVQHVEIVRLPAINSRTR